LFIFFLIEKQKESGIWDTYNYEIMKAKLRTRKRINESVY